jgi:hypothetical protein
MDTTGEKTTRKTKDDMEEDSGKCIKRLENDMW